MARADRRRVARAKPAAGGTSPRYESAYVEGLFFQRLRTHAKWAFVFLAVVFAVGFVAFGVGSDVQGGLDQLFQRTASPDTLSVEDARARVGRNPRDPEALRNLATALQQAGQPEQAINPLTRYTQLRTRDEDALRELAGLHLAKAARLQQEAALAQQQLQELNPGQDFTLPGTTPLGQALSQQPIANAVSSQANDRFTEAYTRMQVAYTAAKTTYQRIAAIAPGDAAVQLQLAETSQNAGDTQTAIAAYGRFLKLAPDDPSAPVVRQQLRALQQSPIAGGG